MNRGFRKKCTFLAIGLLLAYCAGYLALRPGGTNFSWADWTRLTVDPPPDRVAALPNAGEAMNLFFSPLRMLDRKLTDQRVDFSDAAVLRMGEFHIGSTAEF